MRLARHVAHSLTLLRFGVLGDVHQNEEALLRALELFERENVSARLCVGDLADGTGNLDRCCALLQQHSVYVVAGNHDRWLLRGQARELEGAVRLETLSAATSEFLTGLPSTRAFETALGPLLLCHGFGSDDMHGVFLHRTERELREHPQASRLFETFRIVVCGHTHEHGVLYAGATWFINAGTLHPKWKQVACIVDIAERRVQFWNVETLQPTVLEERLLRVDFMAENASELPTPPRGMRSMKARS